MAVADLLSLRSKTETSGVHQPLVENAFLKTRTNMSRCALDKSGINTFL